MIPGFEHYKTKWQVESDRSIKPGLESIQHALKQLNNPENALQVVHLAGTNGKGSTLSFIDSISQAHGLTVGKFMSPCIVDVHDQIQVNGVSITEWELDSIFELFARSGLSGMLTDFELLTCAAFVHFKRKNVNLALIETGMGGLYDSTNVVTPIVSVITSIALEHTNFLGDTITQIATHKAGIIKRCCPVIVGHLPSEANDVVRQTALTLQAPLYVFNEHFTMTGDVPAQTYYHYLEQLEFTQLERGLIGEHQRINAAMAITAFIEVAKALKIEVDAELIKHALKNTTVPGRFEEVLPNVFFDGAHNPASVHALVQTIQTYYPNKKVEIILGMLKDKDVKEVLSFIEPVASKIQFIDIPNDRALSAKQFYDLSIHQNKEIVHDALEVIFAPVQGNTIRIVTGSLYLLADLRAKIKNQSK
jgi:dihydrofolate synthase / folylpolyglutamate synthase